MPTFLFVSISPAAASKTNVSFTGSSFQVACSRQVVPVKSIGSQNGSSAIVFIGSTDDLREKRTFGSSQLRSRQFLCGSSFAKIAKSIGISHPISLWPSETRAAMESFGDRELTVRSWEAQDVEKLTVSGQAFNLPIRRDIVHRVVEWLRAKRRAGTANTKTRSEINCTKKKAYAQKGTGNARHGSKSANIFVGGYKWGGPKPKDWSYSMNKKERILAMKMVLSAKINEGSVVIVDEAKLDVPKTKVFVELLQKNNLADSSVMVIDKVFDKNLQLAARNIPSVSLVPVQSINVYDVLKADKVVLTKEAVKALEEKLLSPIRR